MSAEYSVEEVRTAANVCGGTVGKILTAYAERIEADEGAVTDEVVQRAVQAFAGSLLAQRANGGTAHHKDMRAALLAVWPAQAAQVDAARFGHHPDPATDFCVEVEALLGEIENRRVGFENGTPSQVELDQRIDRALSFRVGGDPQAVMAKQQLRAATTAEPVAMGEVVTPEPFRPALVALLRIRDSSNNENDANVSRAMFDALTTIGWLEKTGRNLWSLTSVGESALATHPHSPDAADSGQLRSAFYDILMECEQGLLGPADTRKLIAAIARRALAAQGQGDIDSCKACGKPWPEYATDSGRVTDEVVRELVEAAGEMMRQDAVQRATHNTNPFMADAADKLNAALRKAGAR